MVGAEVMGAVVGSEVGGSGGARKVGAVVGAAVGALGGINTGGSFHVGAVGARVGGMGGAPIVGGGGGTALTRDRSRAIHASNKNGSFMTNKLLVFLNDVSVCACVSFYRVCDFVFVVD